MTQKQLFSWCIVMVVLGSVCAVAAVVLAFATPWAVAALVASGLGILFSMAGLWCVWRAVWR